ncbi:helix-turn-helix transcriptional regulator [Bacillus thuringiensis]|uniref:helix-turn-helix domain-containing protein n=1 Tax=Bacillus thuringiensis TaxID=1428 RepID=UPI002D7EC99B|nr:helix-turn-helix transcriptional regulator [Bacillus thuringiensis]MEB4893705.1 helix-turn-helix transcriptional regulator [Bacillus thuringiensis]MEC2564929.1 helix-turn-helix transcriptional regulator [Bacillus thuringiensis]MEC2644754.1 helix-turn-helix transcriptional regulator [Bacillus thuringiensis]MEC2727731.1 helix-turn-helix transcriptional regulator [Bacillus thuringiensis]MEC2752515.1 helix-turn-helix transcriptional regulator [Bacillus thuringiensis]
MMTMIREARLQKGWTQLDLAKKSGVPQPTISQIESGERKYPTYQNIKKIAEALGIKAEELMKE